MIGILQKYRLVLVAFALVLFAVLIWLILTRQNLNKIPSRGVFVIKTGQWEELYATTTDEKGI